MSLKAFHLLFMLTSIVIALGTGAWAIQQGNLWLGISAFLLGVILTVYLFWFLKKLKQVSYVAIPLISLLYTEKGLACAVCFGGPNSQLALGASQGIAFLLGVISCVLV